MFNTRTSHFILISLLLISVTIVHCQRPKYIQLNEETWRDLLTGEWMLSLHAPWCPACKSLKPEWDRFAGWSEDLNIKVSAIDVTENPGLSGRFMVTALPTIYHVKDGVFRVYRGQRNSDSFVSFIEEKKWQDAEVLSKWKYPDSIQMSMVSYFFKISMALRTVHNHLVEDYGVPYWGSYMIFAFSTILLGAILGLLIVCVIDLIFPAKIHDLHLDIDSRKPSISEQNEKLDGDEEKIKDNDGDEKSLSENETQLRKRTKKKRSRKENETNAEDNNDDEEEEEEEENDEKLKVIDETKKAT